MSVKLLTEHHLEFLNLKGGCTGSSESIHVKLPQCWKSRVTAQLILSIASEHTVDSQKIILIAQCLSKFQQIQITGFISELFSLLPKKKVSMIRKYHNHKLQTNPWHCEEEPHNNHQTPGRQTKQSNQLTLPHHDDCKTRIDIK